jgi:hypothetical protein
MQVRKEGRKEVTLVLLVTDLLVIEKYENSLKAKNLTGTFVGDKVILPNSN